MIKTKKVLSLLLVAVLVLSIIPAYATEELVSSSPSVSYNELDSSNPEHVIEGEHPVQVTVTKGSAYTINIPKTIVLGGVDGEGYYTVSVGGDLSGTETITVEPYTNEGINLLDENASFDLTQTGKNPVSAKVTQSKIAWSYGNLDDANGLVKATGLTAGSWSGSFKFKIARIGDNSGTLTNIPDGAIYVRTATGEAVRYSEMPETVMMGDMFFYGDYVYSCWESGWNVSLASDNEQNELNKYLQRYYGISNIRLIVPDYPYVSMNQTSYGQILESINGEPIVGLDCTFTGCKSLIVAPAIPKTVRSLQWTFAECTALTTAPVIPSSVNNTQSTFFNCTSLTGTIEINMAGSEYSYGDFENVDFEKQQIVLIGTSPLLDTLGSSGINYCAECNGCCKNNH